MSNNILKVAGLVSLLAAMSGCAMATGGSAGAMGSIYTDYQSPGAIGSGEASQKSGEACVSSILGILATGDASIDAAAKAGGITKVSHVDHSNFGILGLYAKTCTIARGN